jgi:putative SOS response-associated peptidase YedK
MPGRLSVYDDASFKEDVKKEFGIFKDEVGELHKQYNVAPTLSIPVYTNTGVYASAHFGLIPSWASSRRAMQVNARSESVYEKSSFKEAYKQRRCLIPVNGYFEWERDAVTKTSKAHFVVSATHDYVVFAGIYELWYDNDSKETILTCALITTEPNEKIVAIHDRMPVILEQHNWALWLNDKSTYSELNELYKPIASEKIKLIPVGHMVNSVKNNSIECIKEVPHSKDVQLTLF